MQKPSNTYVTNTTLKRGLKGVHTKIETSTQRLDKKIDDSFQSLDKKINDTNQRMETEFQVVHRKIDDTNQRMTKEFQAVHQKIDDRTQRLEKSIRAVAIDLVATKDELKHMKEIMATKTDINLILDRIDQFSRNVAVVERNDQYHSFRLKDIEMRSNDHEKRLSALEGHSRS